MSRYLYAFASLAALCAAPAFAKPDDRGAQPAPDLLTPPAAAAAGEPLVSNQADPESQSPLGAVELPAEVTAQLEAAATNLETAQRNLADAEAEIERLTADNDRQRGALAQMDRDLQAARKGGGKETAPAKAADVVAKLSVQVRVNRGVVHHERADGGRAVAGESFAVTDAEAKDLAGLAARDTVTLSAA